MAIKLSKELQDALRRQPVDLPYRVEDDTQTPWVVVRLDVFERMQRLSGEHQPLPDESPTVAESTGTLPDWCDVYAGLSDEEIENVESVILSRADLSRPE